jgi:mannose-6-phosphate isomerase-like protein (cupin superfamily)
MRHLSISDIRGKVINPGTVNERLIKLLASPKGPIVRKEYGCGVTIVTPGQIHEEHAHPDSEELILVLQGTGTGKVSGQEIQIGPRDIVAISKGESHQFANTGSEELILYWIYSPSGPEVRFLDESL